MNEMDRGKERQREHIAVDKQAMKRAKTDFTESEIKKQTPTRTGKETHRDTTAKRLEWQAASVSLR